jgi:hypothetical protein
VYTDAQTYDASGANMKVVEPSLGWTAVAPATPKITIAVSTDTLSVCLTEASKSGTIFSILDVAQGTTAGTYYGKVACSTITVPVAGGAIPGTFTGSW